MVVCNKHDMDESDDWLFEFDDIIIINDTYIHKGFFAIPDVKLFAIQR